MSIISKIENPSIILKEWINEKYYREIKGLENICIQRDSISFKLELEYKLSNLKQSEIFNNINEFMFYTNNLLIGYIGIGDFGGASLEINGMVHPDYRKMGVFSKLFSLVKDEWMKRKHKEMLLLSDKKSVSGIKFIKNVSESYDHSEYDMFLNINMVPTLEQYSLSLKSAIKTDCAKVAKMDSEFFDIIVKEDDEYIIENIENETTFIASADNIDIGKVRIELNNGVGGIYGLGILSNYRGNGYGRELLLSSISKLINMGADKIVLQVETNNKNALSLYKSCGFEENYVMEYYKLSK